MKTHRITLENDFHRTSVRVLVPLNIASQGEAFGWLENQARAAGAPQSIRDRFRLVRRALCGMSDCQCGTLRPAYHYHAGHSQPCDCD